MTAKRVQELPEYAVETVKLSKTYRGDRRQPVKRALIEVDLAIRRGAIFGLLGPNGAGKSTLINILAGVVVKSSGTARVWGADIEREMRRARSAIGVVPQEVNLDAFFSPREMVEFQAGLHGVPKAERRTDEILEAVGLIEQADYYARSLSGGMRRRLLVAKALAHSPPVLVLDEPTAGVDIELRHQLWDHLRALNARGTTILLTTHYLEEAEELCEEIAIINHGRLVACDTTPALIARLDDKELAIIVTDSLAEVPDLLERFSVTLHPPHRLVFRFRPSRTRISDILSAVREAELGIADLSTEEADLEDIFLKLTRSDAETAEAADGKAEATQRGPEHPQAESVAQSRTRPAP